MPEAAPRVRDRDDARGDRERRELVLLVALHAGSAALSAGSNGSLASREAEATIEEKEALSIDEKEASRGIEH